MNKRDKIEGARRRGVTGWILIILAAPGLGFPEAQAASLAEPKVITSPNSQAGGGFGLGVKRLPDLTNDGIDELWVNTGETPRRSYVFDGNTFELLHALSPPRPRDGNFHTVSSAGDLNDDGVPEIMAGYFDFNDPGDVFIFDGADGSHLYTIPSPAPGTSSRLNNFGRGVWLIPDVTGDERQDWLVYQREGMSEVGRAFVFDSATREPIRTITNQDRGADFWISSMAPIHDVDGDGEVDVVISHLHADVQRGGSLISQAGRAVVRSLTTGRVIYELHDPEPKENGKFAWNITPLGDIDGDTVPDIALRSRHNSRIEGGIYLYSGADGEFIRVLTSPSPVFEGRFGGHITLPLADFNGDGVAELWASEWGAGLYHVVDPITGEVLDTLQDPTADGPPSRSSTVLMRKGGAEVHAYVYSSEFGTLQGTVEKPRSGWGENPGAVWVITLPQAAQKPLLEAGRLALDGFHLEISGPAGMLVDLQATDDWTHWDTISQHELTEESKEVVDGDANEKQFRFYRLIEAEQ